MTLKFHDNSCLVSTIEFTFFKSYILLLYSQVMASSSRNKVFLMGNLEEEILGAKLPSKRQVLSHFLYLHTEKKMMTRLASKCVLEKVETFWHRARVPTRYRQDSIKQLESLFEKWQGLKKNANRQTATQRSNEEKFMETMDDLFDIAHADALSMIKIEEDRKFLLSQREKGRSGSMTSVDTVLHRKERKTEERIALQQKRKEVAACTSASLQKNARLASSSSSETEDEVEASPSFTTPSPPKRARKRVVTPALSAALDRTKVSDRAAVMIVGETARSLGHDVADLTLNRTSIRRQRMECRTEAFRSITAEFTPEDSLIVHWDGKLIPDITGKEKVDRLPILVSFKGTSKLLEVLKLPSGTGEAQAQAVVDSLKKWGIEDKVQAMCFDTTSSNTGRHKGACILIEQLLGRKLLHLGCRHHIMELILAAAFGECMGSSFSPDILLFKRFQSRWASIDQSQYEDSTTDNHARALVADVKDTMLAWLSSALEMTYPRDDYRELLELTMLFLGSPPPRGIHFHAPGAVHQGRWMAKAIYAIKIWMFRSQFRLTPSEEKGLRELCVFLARIYTKAWTTSPLVASAPLHDLSMLQALVKYRTISTGISRVTSQKMSSHLWYLSEELIGLSLFDDDVPSDVKDQMVKAMGSVDGEEDPPKRAKVDLDTVAESSVVSFVTKTTRTLLTKLQLPDDFLQMPAGQWKDNTSYKEAETIVKSLAVINDHAERGVALIQAYSGYLTKDEEQLRFLLQVVEDHRR